MSEKSSNKVLSVLLIFFILILLVAGIGVLAWWMNQEEVPQKTILEVNLDQALLEYVPDDPIGALLFDKKMRMRDFVEALEAAADDEHVVGLVARVNPSGIGIAQIDELRDAFLRFRESGKPTVAYADTFGEVVPANGAYYLASAFDEVYIQPSGDVGFTGLAIESPFIRGTLDKIGVEPRWSTRYEYKTAGHIFTETGYTEPEREALDELIGSIYDHMTERIAASRGMDVATFQALVDRAPLLGAEAQETGLVDGLKYRDEVYDRVHELAGDDDAELLYLNKYWNRTDKPHAEGDHTVGLVYAIGGVQRGSNEYDPWNDSFVMGSDSVSAHLRAAIDDPDVEAIVLRVDSPGGSYVASDTIWREVERAQEAGKPVVVSMGNLAASGGYFVSMGADKIVAEPSTITGSIGVLGGKFNTREMWNKLGVTFDSVKRGDNADMWSAVKPFDDAQWEKFNSWLDRVYEDFTSKVAEGRDLPLERVQEIAKGRVWSGVDALDLGLVDELGGLSRAIQLAGEEAGLAADAKLKVKEFPGKTSPWQSIFGEGPENSEQQTATAAALAVLEKVRPVIQAAQKAGLVDPNSGVLSLPPMDGPK